MTCLSCQERARLYREAVVALRDRDYARYCELINTANASYKLDLKAVIALFTHKQP